MKHESALPLALIGVNIWHLQFFSAVSQQPEEAFLPLSTSTLIRTDLEKHCQEQKVDTFLLAPLSNLCSSSEKIKKGRQGLNSAACTNNETFRATTAKELSIKAAPTKRNILPPSTGESHFLSHICLVLSSSPLYLSFSSPLSSAANFEQTNQRWHRHYPPSMAHCSEGTNTDELALLHLHCVQFPIVLPGLMNGQTGSMYHSALCFCLPVSSPNSDLCRLEYPNAVIPPAS